MRGRHPAVEVRAHAHLRLAADPPALVATRERSAPEPADVEATGTYGLLDPARSRADVIAIERVQAWDLDETPMFGAPRALRC